MTTLGVFASSVVTAACTDVLAEPFNNFTAWTVTGSPTITASGRTGNGGQFTNTSMWIDYTIPAANESDTLTVGLAWKASSFALTSTSIVEFRSDSGATQHNIVGINNSGNILITGVGTVGSAAHGMTAGTFNYIEVQIKLHDTAGTAIVRINSVEKINVSAKDTKNAGTKTVYDRIRVPGPGSGVTVVVDDLYLSAGAGCPFKGSITIP